MTSDKGLDSMSESEFKWSLQFLLQKEYYAERMELPTFLIPAVLPSNKFHIDMYTQNNPAKELGAYNNRTFYFEFRNN
jgi:hypothetical protein